MAHMKAEIKKVGAFLLLAGAVFAGGVMVSAGPGGASPENAALDEMFSGEAKFVSFQSFGDEMCPLPTAGGRTMPYTNYRLEAQAGGAAQASSARSTHLERAPLRYIKDPWPAWSSVAVNPENDMVVLTDENLHRIVEYRRLDNTAPNVDFTEPRRVIGGDQTNTEMMCGVYIDPKTLDVRVTNNDTVNWLPVFSREARGNVAPDRKLATPHRTWGIAADEIRQELYVTIQNPSAVVVYRKSAEGDNEPLRFLEGDATQLADARGLAVDTVNNVFVVGNHGHRQFYGGPAISSLGGTWAQWIARNGFPQQTGLRSLPRETRPELGARCEEPSINIYQLGASGNTAPLRVIKGSRTQLNWPGHVAVHEKRQEIFVANDAGDGILVFRLSDSGNVAPTRVLRGARTGIFAPTGVALDRVNNELWVANMGNYGVTVYPLTASGDVAPLRTIRGGPAGRTGLVTEPHGARHSVQRTGR
jgi:6-phosphogluconolactonase (cycloisomerase 2 family)